MSTDIVSRLHGRSPLGMTGTMSFQSQELFYEWQLVLNASKTAHDVVVAVERPNPDDRFSVQPPGTTISDLTPKWMSGFPEPTRRADFYSRSVRFPIVGFPKPVAQVVVRRLLSSGPISSANLIRLGGIVAGDCAVDDEQSDREVDAKRLQALAEALPAAIRTPGVEGTLPRSGDFGDASLEEQEVSVEARCATDACENVIVKQLEVRLGMSPAEFARLQQYQICEDLADSVRAITGCVEGPTCSNSEALPCEFSMCAGTTLSEEQSLRLMSLLERKGVAVQMTPVSPEQQ